MAHDPFILRTAGPNRLPLTQVLRRGTLARFPCGLSAPAILWLAAASLTAIFAIFAFNLHASRTDVGEAARTSSMNLVATVGQHISREVELLDLSLQDLRDGAENKGVAALPPNLRQLVLFDRAATAKGIGTLLLLDGAGRLIEQAGSATPDAVDFSRETFFKVHAADDETGLFVSPVFVSLVDGEPSIALSRRVDRDGTFAGVAVATIKTSYIKELFAALDLGPKGEITLLGDEGITLVRQPFAAPSVSHVAAPSSLLERIASERTGSLDDVSAVDGVRRAFFFHRVGALPLTIVLGRSVHDIYAAWWRRAAWTGVALLILGALMLVLVAALQIALRRRAAAEAELATLARSDKLTGLANRRKFDESLDAEWRRSGREQRSLSLLLLDVDHFKSYNDRFGHQGGDEVLAAVGLCLAGIPRRPPDLVARYGGEEFAFLLPNTDEADALRLAKKIQAVIRALGRPHPSSPTGLLTVSIGVAARCPGAVGAPADLLRSADEALYRAKNGGRNTIVLWQESKAA